MKKLGIVIFIALVFAACNNGNRDYNMDTNLASPAGSDDSTAPTVFDTSASGVQDSSTVIGYDTAARKQ